MFLSVLAVSAALVGNSLAGAAPSPSDGRTVSVAQTEACVLTVVLQCDAKAQTGADRCKVVAEDPNSLGAGQAALAMSAGFHLPVSADGAPVLIPVRIRTGQCIAGR